MTDNTAREALATLLLDIYGPWGGPPKVRKAVWKRHLEHADRLIAALPGLGYRPALDVISDFEAYVTNMAETPDIRDHTYQMITGFMDEQGKAND